MSTIEPPRSRPLSTIGTTLSRARCKQPARIERMKKSLAAHGQMTPLIAVVRSGTLELVDGFKRHAAASMMAWPTLLVTETTLDEPSQWATMLALNCGPQSMTELDEALVLRELVGTGLTQVQIASLVGRHKSWVSRRIGLVERLHPELVEGMRLGLLHPGTARRLLSLPRGNQLEMATAIQSAGLGAKDTELLVSLWHRAREGPARRALLSDPRAILATHRPETPKAPIDPRLTPQGQRLQRLLHWVEHAAASTTMLLEQAEPPANDLAILRKDIQRAKRAVCPLATVLGSLGSSESGAATVESGAIG